MEMHYIVESMSKTITRPEDRAVIREKQKMEECISNV